jgi:hypothetical protein
MPLTSGPRKANIAATAAGQLSFDAPWAPQLGALQVPPTPWWGAFNYRQPGWLGRSPGQPGWR